MTDDGGALDETTLIERCLSGDAEACKTLFDTHHAMVAGVARRMLRDAAAAEDVTQEVFERVFLNLHRFRRDAGLATWIRRIVTNRCLNRLELKGRNVSLEDVGDRLPCSTDELGDSERATDLEEGLARLDPRERALVVMAAAQPVSYEQMGKVFSLGRDEVRGRLYRARKKLKEWLRW